MHASDPFGWVGSVIDEQFAVEALAGEGAFGVVYRGRHLGFDAPIAVKCLKIPAGLSPEQQDGFLAKFREEARLLHQLSRRTMGIVQALDIGAAAAPKGPWTPYIVMEWLEGETLEQELRRRRDESAPPRGLVDAIQLLSPVAAALAVAHDEHVSHRDVKPANLFLADGRMKVLDFGLAKVFAETPTFAEALAQTGKTFRAFTPQYGAPEQFSPRFGATGPWTDVYAMALILIEVATGNPALTGNDVIQLFVASSDEAARPSLRARGVDASAEVDAVIARALAINPAHRYRTLGEMWAALEGAQRARAIEVARDTLRAPAFFGDDQSYEMSGVVVGVGIGAPEQRGTPAAHVPELPPPPPLPSAWAPESSKGAGAPSQDRSSTRGAVTVAFEGGEHRVCTVMFADLSDATGLSSRLNPEEVKDIVDRCFQVLAEHIEDMQGIVETPIGGRVMAVFGVPRSTDHDAERAIVAALGIQAAIPRLALPRGARPSRLSVRLGITTGRVFIGAGGSARQELAIIGEAVDAAARLQQRAPRGSIVIGRDTHRLVLGRFRVEPLEPGQNGDSGSIVPLSEAAARGSALPVYRVLGESPLHDAFAPPSFHGLPTRLVGRAAEMARLRDVVGTALHERRARLVTLVGPAGVGRTRMLSDLVASLAASEQGGGRTRESGVPSHARGGMREPGVPRHASETGQAGSGAIDAPPGGLLVMAAQCSALARDTSYGLAAALLRRRFGIHEADPPEVIWHKLRRGFRWFTLRSRLPARSAPAEPRPASARTPNPEPRPAWSRAPRGDAAPKWRAGPTSYEDDLEPAPSVVRPLSTTDADGVLATVAVILGASPSPGSAQRPTRQHAEGAPLAKPRVLNALFRLVASALERTPVVIVCDDIHVADDASLDLLEELVARAEGLPLCIVCAGRPELYERRPRWGEGHDGIVRVDAPALARRHIEEMIRDRLRRVPELKPDVVRLLAERAEGSPHTLEELLQLLLDVGVIETPDPAEGPAHAAARPASTERPANAAPPPAHADGELRAQEPGDAPWRVHESALTTLTLPATVQGLVQARLDRLDAEARSVLAQAAVIGRTFWESAIDRLRQTVPQGRSPMSTERLLAELQDLDPPFSVRHEQGASTAQLLARLCERQLVRQRSPSSFPGEREYAFAEQATCEVAYEMLSLKVRRRIHLLVADWIEQHAPGEAQAALVAHHYDRGGDAAAAAIAYVRAAAHAVAVGERTEALRHFTRARELHDEAAADEPQRGAAWDGVEHRIASWRDRVSLRLDLGDVLRTLGDLDGAERAYEEARARILRRERRAGAAHDPAEELCWEARVDLRAALVLRERGAALEALELARRALQRADAGRAHQELSAARELLELLENSAA